MRPLRILTWHIHGSYLYYLTRVPHVFYLPVDPERSQGYVGRTASYSWPDNVVEVPADEVKNLELDCILFQSQKNYLDDQYKILTPKQRNLPKIYLEHDPPRESPTDTPHVVNDENILLVHVTSFNRLMWSNGVTPTLVIDHGVIIPEDVHYTGEKERGIVVINNIKKRGRRLGLDIFERAKAKIPLDLVGMGFDEVSGLREIPHSELPGFEAQYRFFFNPIRYTSLGLSTCEAMMIGMPIVGLATTELVTVVKDGISGFIDTDPEILNEKMADLIRYPDLAKRLGQEARKTALNRFSIERFKDDWMRALAFVTDLATARAKNKSGLMKFQITDEGNNFDDANRSHQ
jgi:glycosyltransferase involved in cell wall biosynthesis